jgi:hypothetical protein
VHSGPSPATGSDSRRIFRALFPIGASQRRVTCSPSARVQCVWLVRRGCANSFAAYAFHCQRRADFVAPTGGVRTPVRSRDAGTDHCAQGDSDCHDDVTVVPNEAGGLRLRLDDGWHSAAILSTRVKPRRCDASYGWMRSMLAATKRTHRLGGRRTSEHIIVTVSRRIACTTHSTPSAPELVVSRVPESPLSPAAEGRTCRERDPSGEPRTAPAQSLAHQASTGNFLTGCTVGSHAFVRC